MRLTELRCLVEIVDANLNISAAAAAMHTSQPGVSRHLKQLEHTLGFQVFSRHGRALVDITPAGRRVIEAARRIIREVDGLRSYAANQRGDTSGELLITAPETYARHVLPPMLVRLLERYPGLSVRMQPLGEGERLKTTDRNHSDLVLLSTAGNRVPDGIALPLFRWKRVVIAAHGHPLCSGAGPVDLAQLARWPLVTYGSSRRADSTLCRALADAGLEAHFACSAQDAGLIKTYVRAGLGVGLVAELAITESDREYFSVRPADPAIPDCTAWAVLPEGRVLRDPALALISLLAPQLDRDDVRRAAEGMLPDGWAEPVVFDGVGLPRMAATPPDEAVEGPLHTP